MKLCKPMVEKDLPKNPDYVNISPSNDVIRKLESLEYKEPFSMNGFSNNHLDIANITLF